ncbi:hypothetical protein LAZ67_16001129 [Cordylochernes scorpioides]|uniref:Uncharacterized protein n=1 Tax=Cordylochernes scorpioides TaxID=51811 RepID=A0ABY6LD83_9ARAC|nr:hypothetical protein LAZ67_16001129 [Cordylochernes scorpioides]
MEILNLICSTMKLERDKGIAELQRNLNTTETDSIIVFINNLKSIYGQDALTWEKKLGALLATKILIPHVKKIDDTRFLYELVTVAQTYLTDNEVRVRLAAGEVLGALCEQLGVEVYKACHEYVFKLIEENLEREVIDAGSLSFEELKEIDNLRRKLESAGREKAAPNMEYKRCSSCIPGLGDLTGTREEIFHDTSGWKCLETSMKCLQAMVDGCGAKFAPWVSQQLLDVIFRALGHTNRFVRETGFYVLGSLVACGLDEAGAITSDSPFHAEKLGIQVSQALAKGLGDNWSQVRLASSEVTRKFLLSFPTDEQRVAFYPILLPRMCLNRYYVADGVRIYSQDSWRSVARTQGKELVQRYIAQFVEYYVSQTKANNHAVREAACACIAELAAKVTIHGLTNLLPRKLWPPYVPLLLQTLLECFKDDSWPVRDAACLASGNFVVCYPEEARSVIDQLYPHFFENLCDPILQ